MHWVRVRGGVDYTDELNTRHGFLQALHKLLQPQVYLEVGVQYGTSLALAQQAQIAIGIDPDPQVTPENTRANQRVERMTADAFFAQPPALSVLTTAGAIDLAFIDGSHLAEDAWRDYENIRKHIHPNGVIVFDDVLPRNVGEARRIPPGYPIVGDWTGDVWKLVECGVWGAQTQILVDTWPTGLLVCTRFGEDNYAPGVLSANELTREQDPPERILTRAGALPAAAALQVLLDLGAGRR